jgi:hypothetical protein
VISVCQCGMSVARLRYLPPVSRLFLLCAFQLTIQLTSLLLTRLLHWHMSENMLVCCSTWDFFKTRQSTIWERHPVGQSLVLSGLVAGAAGISSNVWSVGAFYLILCYKRSLLIIVRNRSLI